MTIMELFYDPTLLEKNSKHFKASYDGTFRVLIENTETEYEVHLKMYDNGTLYTDNYSNTVAVYPEDTPIEIDDELNCIYFN